MCAKIRLSHATNQVPGGVFAREDLRAAFSVRAAPSSSFRNRDCRHPPGEASVPPSLPRTRHTDGPALNAGGRFSSRPRPFLAASDARHGDITKKSRLFF